VAAEARGGAREAGAWDGIVPLSSGEKRGESANGTPWSEGCAAHCEASRLSLGFVPSSSLQLPQHLQSKQSISIIALQLAAEALAGLP